MQPESITRPVAAAVAAVVCLSSVAAGAVATWRDAPEYVAIFAPRVHRGAYRASVSSAALETVLQEMAGDPTLVRAEGAWAVRRQPATDAFGRSGGYDRWTLARLYGARQPQVARGARAENGRIVESWTLVSPYPSADFGRLDPGTLRIVLRIAP